MFLRLTIGLIAIMGIALSAGWLFQNSPEARQAAAKMTGDRWYRLTLRERHIGYLHTTIAEDLQGQWRFSSDLRFALAANEPVTIRDQLTFAANPPYPLIAAKHHQHTREQRQDIELAPSTHGLIAHINVDDRTTTQTLTWSYTLSDYLGFEIWLTTTHPNVGASKTSPTIDFDRLAVVSRVFRVVAETEVGYEVENPAPLDDTRIQLDRVHRPIAMTMAGLFDLKLSDRSEALEPRSTLTNASYLIPLDVSLHQHQNIARLELDIEGASKHWPSPLVLHANPTTDPDRQTTYLEETLQFPVNDPRILQLARQATDSVHPQQQINDLVAFVHNYLRYEPSASSKGVINVLNDPRGDCTEFADLFTSLARALSIPSKTTIGLAYSDSPEPAFAFHAWNEVLIGDRWRAVDPTWNQLRVDATHIPLPTRLPAALNLVTGPSDIKFVVRSVDYFDDAG